MFCCTCAGSCCHVGPHSYCAVHQPNMMPFVYTPLAPCKCCYCILAEPTTNRLQPHYRCCKCGDERAVNPYVVH